MLMPWARSENYTRVMGSDDPHQDWHVEYTSEVLAGFLLFLLLLL